MADFPLTPAQRAAVEHRGAPLLIAAGAGSGKTRVLVERLLHRIRTDGLDVDRFLLITYTRAAAAELRSRIQDALSRDLAREPRSRLLRRQLNLIPRADIGTIHSFCASLLRENAASLGVRPDFRQMDEAESAVVRGEVLDEVLQKRYGEMDPDFRELADTMGGGLDDRQLREAVLKTYDAVQSHPDPAAWLRQQQEAPLPEGDVSGTVWGARLLRKAGAAAAYWARQLEGVLAELPAEPKLQAAYEPSLRGTRDSLLAFREALDRGWDEACACGGAVFPNMTAPRGMGDHPLALRAKTIRKSCKDRMDRVSALFDTDSAGHRQDLEAVRGAVSALFRLTGDFAEAYAAEKKRRAALDFSDLEHMALGLLTLADGSPSPLAEAVSRRYEEILVDEYQDCNRVQEQIFRAVSRNGQNLVMVGDVKQSIYRFRLADPSLFLEKYRTYRDEPQPGEGRRILLQQNFRSDPGILRGVNGLFSLLFSPELGEMSYGAAEALLPGAGPDAEGTPGSFELRLLETKDSGLKPEAEALALRVEQILGEGILVKQEKGERPLAPGDIAILLRSARGRDREYAEALRRRGIPAVCQRAGEALTERREVIWALSLLEIVDNPRQDIPLIAALRSPVWSWTADQLAGLRSGSRKGCLYDALTDRAKTDEASARVLEELESFRTLAADLPADRLLTELYARTGLPAAAEAREKGSSLWLEELASTARELERSGCRGLFRFLERLREAKERSVSPGTAAAGGSGVRITTVHASKGLEYPVVILADMARRFHRAEDGSPILIHPLLGAGTRRSDLERGIRYPTLARLAVADQLDREGLSEELRVLYVAATRAKQKLVVFLRCRDRVKYLSDLSLWAGDPPEPQALADRSCLGDWIAIAALSRRQAGAWALQPADAPELRTEKRPEAAPPEPGEREGEALKARLREAVDWRYPREADTRLPSKVTATALRETVRQEEAAEAAVTLTAKGKRDFRLPDFTGEPGPLTPAERGTALHLALQYARPECCLEPESARRELARLRESRFLRPEQADAVDPADLTAYYRSPLGRRTLACPAAHREFKFSLLAPASLLEEAGQGRVLIQGVVDCWLEEPEGVTVIDYKTDRVTRAGQQARAEEYAPQLRAYAWALEQITGKRVIETYVYFFATKEAVALPLQN